ncbi:uncharacterized protein znf1067 [Halichoeres trimaculatus]|uniref:uncharacterized protein znf1067 n=1 Tax=Halichoeres trimaculatus TaxID=147232 RepID=UPI003D9E37A1
MAKYRDPHLPLSSLHLLIPPLRMTSACLWQVALDRNVDRYEQLAKFITLVTEIVPDLLSYRQRTQLILGLRARVVMDLITKQESIDFNAVQEHLDIFHQSTSYSHEGDGDQEVQKSKAAFVEQVQTLLKDHYEKEKFVKEVFPELYGARFDTVLQILVWEFLHRLEEFLPVPSFSKVSSFIDLSSFDPQFEQFFCDQEDLKRILQHQNQRTKLPKSEFSFTSDTILSTLASGQTLETSESHLQSVKLEEGGDCTDEETDESSAEPSNSQWQDRGLSPLTNSLCSEEVGMEDENDNISSLVSQGVPASLQVVYETQVTLLEENSEDPAAQSTIVQEMSDPGGFNVNLATSLKEIEDLTCPVCFKTFRKPRTAKRHLKSAHPMPEQVFRCDKCDKTFQEKWRLDQHLQAHSIKKPYVCAHCGKGLSCPKVLETHMRLHTGERPYACKLCDKKFDQKYTLTQHIRTHKGEKPYLCSVCGKTFALKGALRVHTRQHTGERPYHCKECGQSYRTLQTLKSHQTLHTNERPYTCPQCGKNFRLQSGYKKHMRIHTGEKPYQCVVCEKRFYTSSNLRIHMKSHKEAKASAQ